MELRVRIHDLPEDDADAAVAVADPLADRALDQGPAWHLEPVFDGGEVGASASFEQDGFRRAMDLTARWTDGQRPEQQNWRVVTAVDRTVRLGWKANAMVYAMTGLNVILASGAGVGIWLWTRELLGGWAWALSIAGGLVAMVLILMVSLWILGRLGSASPAEKAALKSRRQAWSRQVRKGVVEHSRLD